MRRWGVAFLFAAAVVVASVAWIDRPAALFAARLHLDAGLLSEPYVARPYLVALGTVSLLVGGFALACGTFLPPWARNFARAAFFSGLAMASGLGLTEYALKPLFGRTLPEAFLHRGLYGFHWLHGGDAYGSFPSGHSVQIMSMASVFWVAYPRWRPFWAACAAATATALVLAERHFVSDVLAGGMVGAGAGAAIMQLWRCGLPDVGLRFAAPRDSLRRETRLWRRTAGMR